MTESRQIPLFPLKLVLFPGGKLDLQIFEQRYIDLVSQCLRQDSGFGICLLKSGEEVIQAGSRQVIHRVGTFVQISDWDQLENGLLGITVEGRAKFHVQDCWQADSGVLEARVKFSAVDDVRSKPVPVSEEFSGLTDLLRSLENHPMVQQKHLDIDYDNLHELGWRLSELLPVEAGVRQALLELDDPLQRVQRIEQLVSDIANNS